MTPLFSGLRLTSTYSTFWIEDAPPKPLDFTLLSSKDRRLGADEVEIVDSNGHMLASDDRNVFRFRHPEIGRLSRMLANGKVDEARSQFARVVGDVFEKLEPSQVQGTKYRGRHNGWYMATEKETLRGENLANYLEHYKRLVAERLPGLQPEQIIHFQDNGRRWHGFRTSRHQLRVRTGADHSEVRLAVLGVSAPFMPNLSRGLGLFG